VTPKRGAEAHAPTLAKVAAACLVVAALLIAVQTTVDFGRRVGRPFAGFMVMENLLVAVGGGERGGLQPFDLVRTMNGQVLASGRGVQAEIARHPSGTTFHYILYRRGRLVEADVTSRTTTRHDLVRFLLEGIGAGFLILSLGTLVVYLKPQSSRSWVFFAFCLVWAIIDFTYADAHATYRLGPLFLLVWAFSPAVFIHLALIFPQRRSIARRFPRVVWLPYVLSGALGGVLQVPLPPGQVAVWAGTGAAYWVGSLLLLVVSLARTSLRGATPAARQRARVLAGGFAVAYLPAVLGTAVEALLRVPVPHLEVMWWLTFVFPAAVAYAMVRYDLFDLRSAIRLGTIYSVVTGLIVLAYTGAIALVDLLFSRLDLTVSRVVPAAVVALAVVLLLNPTYVRLQRGIDRIFFRQRYDVQRSLEHVSEVMTGTLDLQRIVGLITGTVGDLLHPVRLALLLDDAQAGGLFSAGEGDGSPGPVLAGGSALPVSLARVRAPVSRERLDEDPGLRDLREGCLAEMEALGAELAVPIFFRDHLTGLLALGPKRSGAAYTTDDLRLLRMLANQSAVALEHAKAYAALEAANAELKVALRRVEILESIRASLAKFVPRTVQALIEQAPEAPELDKREADVSVLFVDIVGYTRLSARLEPERVNRLVERYFGSYLDEILRRGGDVNETAGDELMVIFQDGEPRRHARAAVLTALGILRRTRQINAELAGESEPIAVHIGVNSGRATVGATKIEGATGTRWTYTASGQVTNLAARLAAIAEGDAVLAGPETRARLGTEFLFEEVGAQALKNIEEPIRVFRVAPAR
jgi:class 3 adenylate cyclase